MDCQHDWEHVTTHGCEACEVPPYLYLSCLICDEWISLEDPRYWPINETVPEDRRRIDDLI